MSSKETGGPAFPYSGVHHTEEMNHIIDSHGMTLRDYFAAKAMQAIMTNPASKDIDIAWLSFTIADQMLAARNITE